MGNCKIYQNNGTGPILLYCRIHCSPVWARSSRSHLLDTELNQAFQSITGYLKHTNVDDLYFLSVFAPPDIRRNACARVEPTKHTRKETHALFGYIPTIRHLKPRQYFLTSVQPVHFPLRCNASKRRLRHMLHNGITHLHKDIVKGHDGPWITWRCLNRLRTGLTCSKEQRKKWVYYDGDTTSECGLAIENTWYMLQCTLLSHPGMTFECSMRKENRVMNEGRNRFHVMR